MTCNELWLGENISRALVHQDRHEEEIKLRTLRNFVKSPWKLHHTFFLCTIYAVMRGMGKGSMPDSLLKSLPMGEMSYKRGGITHRDDEFHKDCEVLQVGAGVH